MIYVVTLQLCHVIVVVPHKRRDNLKFSKPVTETKVDNAVGSPDVAPAEVPTQPPVAPAEVQTPPPVAPAEVPTPPPIAPAEVPTPPPVAPSEVPPPPPVAPAEVPTPPPVATAEVPPPPPVATAEVQTPPPVAPAKVPHPLSVAPVEFPPRPETRLIKFKFETFNEEDGLENLDQCHIACSICGNQYVLKRNPKTKEFPYNFTHPSKKNQALQADCPRFLFPKIDVTYVGPMTERILYLMEERRLQHFNRKLKSNETKESMNLSIEELQVPPGLRAVRRLRSQGVLQARYYWRYQVSTSFHKV